MWNMAKVKSMALAGGFSGKLGSVVFVEQPTGTVMRERVIPRNPRTPAQSAWRIAMKRAGEAFRSLTPEQYRAWEQYCQSTAAPGERMRPVVQVFMGLGAKAYHVAAQLGEVPTVPLLPPDRPFGGDSVPIVPIAEAGVVRFEAANPNADGVATELLLQPVTSLFAAAYDSAYRAKAVFEFRPGSLACPVPVLPGCYACAVRFVDKASGQQTAILRLGSVRVLD